MILAPIAFNQEEKSMKVIINVEGLFANGKTYPKGIPVDPDSVLKRLADEGAKRNGVVAVTYIEPPEPAKHEKNEAEEQPAPSAGLKPKPPKTKKSGMAADTRKAVGNPMQMKSTDILTELRDAYNIAAPADIKRKDLIKLLVETRIKARGNK